MSADLFIEILRGAGPFYCVEILGLYLIFSSIIGKVVRVPLMSAREIPLRSERTRLLIGAFGSILALPLIVACYQDVIRGNYRRVTAAQIEETVKQPPATGTSPDSTAGGAHRSGEQSRLQPIEGIGPARAASLTPAAFFPNGEYVQSGDSAVESFGLEQESIRRLKYGPFRGQVYVYVGDIHTVFGTTDLYVFVSPDRNWPASGRIGESDFQQRLAAAKPPSWKLSFKRTGEFLDFTYGNQGYRLTVTRIYSVLIGSNQVAIKIEER